MIENAKAVDSTRFMHIARQMFFIFSLFTIHYSLLTTAASAQRDYFTPEEIELIRDAQQIDERIDVLTAAIDRRFAALKIDVAAPKTIATDSEKWGILPEATHLQLLRDIKQILQKAIDDIDSLAGRPDSMVISPDKDPKEKKTYADLFPKAVRNLAKAARRYETPLKSELDKRQTDAEKGSILDTLDMCSQIIAAIEKLPAEAKKDRK